MQRHHITTTHHASLSLTHTLSLCWPCVSLCVPNEQARLETEIELDSERAFNYNTSNRSSVTSSPALSSSLNSLPPTWALPSPRGLTPSLLTPSVSTSAASLMQSQQLSPIRAPSPKNYGTPTSANRGGMPVEPLSPTDGHPKARVFAEPQAQRDAPTTPK